VELQIPTLCWAVSGTMMYPIRHAPGARIDEEDIGFQSITQ
jgi:hypothetical protein